MPSRFENHSKITQVLPHQISQRQTMRIPCTHIFAQYSHQRISRIQNAPHQTLNHLEIPAKISYQRNTLLYPKI